METTEAVADGLVAFWKRKEVVVGALALGVGVGIGYILGVRKVAKDEGVIVGRITEEHTYVKEDDIEDKPVVVVVEPIVEIPDVSITVNGVEATYELENWDYTEELKNRTAEKPYVISKDEFFGDEKSYDQRTLTYFAGDDILVDEDESPIYNFRVIFGDEPFKFGHGSGDPKVVYIRVDKRRAEYEVLLDEGMYSKEIAGLDIEHNERVEGLKHSNDRVRRFRRE